MVSNGPTLSQVSQVSHTYRIRFTALPANHVPRSLQSFQWQMFSSVFDFQALFGDTKPDTTPTAVRPIIPRGPQS